MPTLLNFSSSAFWMIAWNWRLMEGKGTGWTWISNFCWMFAYVCQMHFHLFFSGCNLGMYLLVGSAFVKKQKNNLFCIPFVLIPQFYVFPSYFPSFPWSQSCTGITPTCRASVWIIELLLWYALHKTWPLFRRIIHAGIIDHRTGS